MENMKNMSIYFSSGAEWSGRRISAESPGARFSKDPKTFRARKAIRETPTCLICKAGLFICCIGNKNQNNCKVSCLETPSFWRYKENYGTRNTPEKVRDFRESGPRSLKTAGREQERAPVTYHGARCIWRGMKSWNLSSAMSVYSQFFCLFCSFHLVDGASSIAASVRLEQALSDEAASASIKLSVPAVLALQAKLWLSIG